jgi:hypothetical protein
MYPVFLDRLQNVPTSAAEIYRLPEDQAPLKSTVPPKNAGTVALGLEGRARRLSGPSPDLRLPGTLPLTSWAEMPSKKTGPLAGCCHG